MVEYGKSEQKADDKAADKAVKADEKAAKAEEKQAEKIPEVKPAPEGVGESGDPAVQKLIADRAALESNREALVPADADADAVKAIDDQIAAVDAQLGELGYK